MASNEKKRPLPNLEEIVKEIWRIVQNDDKLEVFDVIEPSEEESTAENLPPLSHEDNKLTLQECVAKDLFLFVYPKLLERTLDLENQKTFLTTALLLNCQVKTFWNMRRELVLQNELDISVELRFINIVLSFWRKCVDAIIYRQWLLKDKLSEKPFKFLTSELNQVVEIAERQFKNNHVPWQYCMWLVEQCDSRPDFADFVFHAWYLSGQYMSVHIFDASHFTYRWKLVLLILRNHKRMKGKFLKLAKQSATKEGIKGLKQDDALLIGMLVYEFNLNSALMSFGGKNREGVWRYRRSLVWLWTQELPRLVSTHGDRRLQYAGGRVSDHFCAFDMYLHTHFEPNFRRAIKSESPLAEKYREWIAIFCPGAGCWEDEDLCAIA